MIGVDPRGDVQRSPTIGVERILISMLPEFLLFMFICAMLYGNVFSPQSEACTIKLEQSRVLDLLWHSGWDPNFAIDLSSTVKLMLPSVSSRSLASSPTAILCNRLMCKQCEYSTPL